MRHIDGAGLGTVMGRIYHEVVGIVFLWEICYNQIQYKKPFYICVVCKIKLVFGEVICMIKSAVKSDARILAELAIRVWTDNTVMDLEKEFEELITNDNINLFIKYVDNKAIGFEETNRIICFRKDL